MVEGAVTQHREQDVGPLAGQGDDRLVVVFALGAFPVVVGPRRGVVQRGEGREEQRPFEPLVPTAGACSPRIEVPDRRVTGAIPA